LRTPNRQTFDPFFLVLGSWEWELLRVGSAGRLREYRTMKMVRLASAVLVTWLVATPIYAQGPYVGASVGADVARFSSSDGSNNPATGEAFSWALRLGGPIGSRFGAELEFARPEEIKREDTPVGTLADTVRV